MILVELNLFKKALIKILPSIRNNFLVDDYTRIKMLFQNINSSNSEEISKNLTLLFFPMNLIPILKIFKFNNSKIYFLRELLLFITTEKKNFNLRPHLQILSNKNYIRLYRLFLYLKKYKISFKLRNLSINRKILENENKELLSFKKKLYLIKKFNKKNIAVIGPNKDTKKFLKEINKFDEILIINPSNKYCFKQHKTNKFHFFYRSQSIKEIQENRLRLPLTLPTKVILEGYKDLPIKSKNIFKGIQDKCDFGKLIKEKYLIGQLNAIQAAIIHLINKGYSEIGIFSCDLFTTSRFDNKRLDYIEHRKDINNDLKIKRMETDHFVLHDPYLNFTVLKILLEEKIILPYNPLLKILEMDYSDYLKLIHK